ncbi:MAG: hypothetical protein ACOYIP_08140 [Coriobacteriales bacterium]
MAEIRENGRLHVTRREFLLGSAGVAVAAIGTTMIVSGCSSEENEGIVPGELEVSESQVVQSSDFTELETDDCIEQTAAFELPMGSVGTMSCDDLAVFLVPGESTDVLTQIALLSLESATLTTVLGSAVSHDEGFQVYDVRCNDDIMIWVECNLHTEDWRVYIAPVENSASIGTPLLVDQGDYDFDPPLLCVSGKRAFWTVMPYEEGSASDTDSLLKAASVGQKTPDVVYTSQGRMIANPQATDGIVTIVPRVEGARRYQMTALKEGNAEMVAAQILPSSMRVNDAIYLDGSFVFGIEQSYDFGGGISSFGTYAEMGGGQYLRFNRTPMDTPCKCGKYLVIKSTKSVVGLDLSTQEYFAIPTVANCESYGDFLLSTGTSSRIVTYTSVPEGDGSGDGIVKVRAYAPLG